LWENGARAGNPPLYEGPSERFCVSIGIEIMRNIAQAQIATGLGDLHVQCDFLLQNYDLRQEARTNEVESLKNAKAILSGANFR